MLMGPEGIAPLRRMLIWATSLRAAVPGHYENQTSDLEGAILRVEPEWFGQLLGLLGDPIAQSLAREVLPAAFARWTCDPPIHEIDS